MTLAVLAPQLHISAALRLHPAPLTPHVQRLPLPTCPYSDPVLVLSIIYPSHLPLPPGLGTGSVVSLGLARLPVPSPTPAISFYRTYCLTLPPPVPAAPPFDHLASPPRPSRPPSVCGACPPPSVCGACSHGGACPHAAATCCVRGLSTCWYSFSRLLLFLDYHFLSITTFSRVLLYNCILLYSISHLNTFYLI